MKHYRQSSCLPRRRKNCTCDVCGTSIDSRGLDFGQNGQHLVYMEKVFSLNNENSCPIILCIDTGCRQGQSNYVTTLSTRKPGCPCSTCDLDPSAVFTVERSKIQTEAFFIAPTSCINANQVTVDGVPVDSIYPFGKQFVAQTTVLMTEISKRRCMERGLPTKGFLLLNKIGPWALKTRIILEGTVNSNGQTCQFCAEVETAPDKFISLPASTTSNFAIPDLSLPCTTDGISPVIRFQFDANVQVQNPVIHFLGNGRGCGCSCGCDCGCGTQATAQNRDNGCGDRNNENTQPAIRLEANLIVEPIVQVEVTRQSLFNINARESLQPCDALVDCEESEAFVSDDQSECSCKDFEQNGGCGCGSNNCGCGCENNNNCGCGSNNCGCGCENDNSCGCGSDNCGCGCENDNSCGCGCNNCGCGCENDNSCGCRCNNCGNVLGTSNGCACNRGCGQNSPRYELAPTAIQYLGCGCGCNF